MKTKCVLGILDTERGREIARELIEWFSEDYVIYPVIHNGTQFEYPALKRALELSIETGEPILYIHTKGAWNTNPALKTSDEQYYMCPQCNPPSEATIFDWQKTVRKMWKSEFVDNKDWYLEQCNQNKPIVCAPYVSRQKHTWTNGFMFNTNAAKLLYPLKYNSNRWSYEKLWNKTDCECIGRIYNNMDGYPAMYKWKTDVWTHFTD